MSIEVLSLFVGIILGFILAMLREPLYDWLYDHFRNDTGLKD